MQIEHVAIWCRDLERMKAFYLEYFGAKANNRYENPAKGFSSYFLSFAQGARLELMQMPGIPEDRNDPRAQAMGLVHLALSVGSEAKVDELTRQLQADGHEILDGPRRTGDGYYESVVFDPERNRIEITA